MAGPMPGTWDAVLLTEMPIGSRSRGGANEKLEGTLTNPQVPAPGRDVGQGRLRTCGPQGPLPWPSSDPDSLKVGTPQKTAPMNTRTSPAGWEFLRDLLAGVVLVGRGSPLGKVSPNQRLLKNEQLVDTLV